MRNDNTYSYFDNGWTKTSADPWDIVTGYDYNPLGGADLPHPDQRRRAVDGAL